MSKRLGKEYYWRVLVVHQDPCGWLTDHWGDEKAMDRDEHIDMDFSKARLFTFQDALDLCVEMNSMACTYLMMPSHEVDKNG